MTRAAFLGALVALGTLAALVASPAWAGFEREYRGKEHPEAGQKARAVEERVAETKRKEAERNRHRERFDAIHERTEKLDKRYHEATLDLVKRRDEIRDVVSTINETQADITRLTQEGGKVSTLAKLQGKVAKARKQEQALKASYERKRAESVEIMKAIEDLRAQAGGLRDSIDGMTGNSSDYLTGRVEHQTYHAPGGQGQYGHIPAKDRMRMGEEAAAHQIGPGDAARARTGSPRTLLTRAREDVEAASGQVAEKMKAQEQAAADVDAHSNDLRAMLRDRFDSFARTRDGALHVATLNSFESQPARDDRARRDEKIANLDRLIALQTREIQSGRQEGRVLNETIQNRARNIRDRAGLQEQKDAEQARYDAALAALRGSLGARDQAALDGVTTALGQAVTREAAAAEEATRAELALSAAETRLHQTRLDLHALNQTSFPGQHYGQLPPPSGAVSSSAAAANQDG